MFRSVTGTLYANQLAYNQTQSLMCKEIFMMFPVVIYVPKDFYLTEAINDKIQFLQAAGIIDYWHKEIIDERFLKVVESKEPKGIKFAYLTGCFYIWEILCVVATFVFFGEIVSDKLRKLRQRRKWRKLKRRMGIVRKFAQN